MSSKFFNAQHQTLAFGAMAMLALIAALVSALGGFSNGGAHRGAAAMVNGEPIPQAEYQRALSAMQAGLDRTLTEADRERALQILIDEELVVQQALELDLARSDRLARKNLVQALIRSSQIIDAPGDPQEEDLLRLYQDESAFFADPIFATLKVVGASDDERAAAFSRAIADGAEFVEAAKSLHLADISPPPLLPLGKLTDYVGADGRDAVLAMETGDIAGPIAHAGDTIFVWLTEKKGGTPPPFDTIEEQVRAEWLRRQEEDAFGRYVARLRKKARIKKLDAAATQTP